MSSRYNRDSDEDYSSDCSYNSEEEDYEEFGDKIRFDLVELQDEQSRDTGSLKSYGTKDGGLLYYSDDPTGFTISVERLLQADGYADSSVDDTQKQRLTLIVLKLVLACNGSSGISQVTFNMRFCDKSKEKKKEIAQADSPVEPVILAWAPFDKMVKSHETAVQRTQVLKVDGELGADGGGGRAKISTGWEDSMSWTETYFESGHSYPTMGDDQTRTGVRWVLKSNPKAVEGVPPNIEVGVLISRQSDAPYLANFDIRVKGGFWHDLKKGTQRLLGKKPDNTKPYLLAPSEKPITRGSGSQMLTRFDLNAMGKLQGKGDALVWKEDTEAAPGGAAAVPDTLPPGETEALAG